MPTENRTGGDGYTVVGAPGAEDQGPAEVPATCGDVIRLVLPAEPDYGRIARIAASSLALRLGFGFSEIEDLRIAIDEAIIMLLRPSASAELTIEFTIERDALLIDLFPGAGADLDPDANTLDDAAVRRFDEIVSETVDTHHVDARAARVHLVKRY